MFWGPLGAIAPDFDMIYYYTKDDNQNNHHTYITHLPIFWLGLLLISLLWLRRDKNKSRGPTLAFIFSFSGLIHLVLDTFTGPVYWLAPLFNTSFSFVLTGAQYSTELSYFTSWSFVLELFIIWWAIYLHFKKYFR